MAGFAFCNNAAGDIVSPRAMRRALMYHVRRPALRERPFAMQNQVAKTVGALLIRPNGRVLLGLRAPSKKAWPRHWDTIGGHVEDGESLDDALVREIQEEVGVTP